MTEKTDHMLPRGKALDVPSVINPARAEPSPTREAISVAGSPGTDDPSVTDSSVIGSSPEPKMFESAVIASLLLAFIIIAGMGIRFYRLADRSIWYDESSSWRMSQAPLPEMMSRIAAGSHPPLYYFALRLWMGLFGDSLWAMRSLSVLLAGVTMVGVYLFVDEALRWSQPSRSPAHRRWVGLFAAALVATSLLHIRMSWDARMYTLGTALAALSAWTLFRALHSSQPSWRRWTVHGTVTLLFLYTHYFALFSVAGQVLFIAGFLLYRRQWSLATAIRDRLCQQAILTYSLVAAGWAIWLPVFLHQRAQHDEQWWTEPFSFETLPRTCREVFLLTMHIEHTDILGPLLMAACTLAIAGVLWKARQAERYTAAMAIVPVALCIVASMIGPNVFVWRYQLFALLFFLVSVAILVGRARALAIRNLVAILLLVNGLALYAEYWGMLNIMEKPGIRGAVAYIEAEKKPDERVIVGSPMIYYPALYHSTDRDAWRVYSAVEPFSYFAVRALAAPEDYILLEEIEDIRAGGVWVVGGGWGGQTVPIPLHWEVQSVRKFPEVFEFQGVVTVRRYHVGDDSRHVTP